MSACSVLGNAILSTPPELCISGKSESHLLAIVDIAGLETLAATPICLNCPKCPNYPIYQY
jgi:hypothetical protein